MQLEDSLHSLWRRIAFCLRVLSDLVSDLSFSALYWRSSRRGLPPVTNEILLDSAVSLAARIREGRLSSAELVSACVDRITEVNSLINAVVDNRFEEALKEARSCDEIIANLKGDASGLAKLAEDKPFLGIPFSTKEGIRVRGLHHSYGLVSRRNIIAEEDATAVKLLRAAGAIPLCVTNVSELGSWWNSSNNVYGVTSNPHSLAHSPGGSSGGEAALLASAGIILSLGSDTGGSIRTPAAFCGVFGHKPSPQTVSTRGAWIKDNQDEDLTIQSLGPLTRHSEDLAPVTRVLLGLNTHLMSLDREVALSRCQYYILTTQIGGNLTSMLDPEVRLGLQSVVNYIEDFYGVRVRPLHLPELDNCLAMFSAAASRCNNASLVEDSGLSCVLSELLKMLIGRSSYTFPVLVQSLLERTQNVVNCLSSSDDPEPNLEKDLIISDLELLKNKVHNILGDSGLLLCPAHPTPPPYHYQSYSKPFNFLHTAVFNMLGLPATVIPVGASQSRLPLAVQVAAGPYNDHLTLALAQQLENPFGGWVRPFSQL